MPHMQGFINLMNIKIISIQNIKLNGYFKNLYIIYLRNVWLE